MKFRLINATFGIKGIEMFGIIITTRKQLEHLDVFTDKIELDKD